MVAATLTEARGVLGADIRDGQLSLDQAIDVADQAGKIVHCLCFADALTIIWPTFRSR